MDDYYTEQPSGGCCGCLFWLVMGLFLIGIIVTVAGNL